VRRRPEGGRGDRRDGSAGGCRRRGWLDALLGIACVAAAYVLGSIPFSYLIARKVTGGDVRQMGSGNPGATNVMRVAGTGAGVAALATDVGKGVAAVSVPRWLGASMEVQAASAVAATAGHVYPVFLGWRGGKGVATAFGALTTLAPRAALGSVAVFVGTVAATRYVSVGSLAGTATFSLIVATRARSRPGGAALLAASVAVAGLVGVRHRENLRRLRTGGEYRLSRPAVAQRSPQAAEGAGA
jgi:glycerol-3-phosphate acyltransferase PlsY